MFKMPRHWLYRVNEARDRSWTTDRAIRFEQGVRFPMFGIWIAPVELGVHSQCKSGQYLVHSGERPWLAGRRLTLLDTRHKPGLVRDHIRCRMCATINPWTKPCGPGYLTPCSRCGWAG